VPVHDKYLLRLARYNVSEWLETTLHVVGAKTCFGSAGKLGQAKRGILRIQLFREVFD